jgi:sugar phosphate isomerase/epimerase
MAHFAPDCPLSFAHLAAIEVPPLDLVGIVAGAGFASTSLRLRTTGTAVPAYPFRSISERRELRRRLDQCGVSVLYVELVSLTRGLDMTDLEALLDDAAELGATRVLAAGDDPEFAVVVDRLAEVAALAATYNLTVDVEFMPFRPLRSFAHGLRLLGHAGAPNAQLCVDALHFYRAGGRVEELGGAPTGAIGTFQLCDAPASAPADLAFEARHARLLPGEGGLDLAALIRALPQGVPLGVEVPMVRPDLDAAARVRLSADATRRYLAALGV